MSSRSRYGNVPPPSTVRGMPSAASNDTGPRMPAHEMTAMPRHGGDGSFSRTCADSRRGRYVAGKTQTNR